MSPVCTCELRAPSSELPARPELQAPSFKLRGRTRPDGATGLPIADCGLRIRGRTRPDGQDRIVDCRLWIVDPRADQPCRALSGLRLTGELREDSADLAPAADPDLGGAPAGGAFELVGTLGDLQPVEIPAAAAAGNRNSLSPAEIGSHGLSTARPACRPLPARLPFFYDKHFLRLRPRRIPDSRFQMPEPGADPPWRGDASPESEEYPRR